MSLDELDNAILQKQANQVDCKAERVEWHRRFSLPFACVVFSLIALPLSTQAAWSFRSHGFVVSLSVILVYYLLLTTGETLGKKGVLPPAVALWLPNAVLGAVASISFRELPKKRGFFGFSAW